MNYRNGNDEYSQQRISSSSLSSTGGNLPKTVVGHSSSLEDDQDTSKKVDEYLEFLDKRYNRMHGNDGPQRKPFSVLKWLNHEDHMEHSEETQSNALYALGVAGLASERLLQKHGVHLTQCSVVQPSLSSTNEDDSIVVECESSPETTPLDNMSLLLNKIFATFAAKIVSLHRQITVRRHLMLKALSRKSRAIGKTALAFMPKASSDFARALVKAGGGERNIKIAATAMCAFAIYIAQPLIKSAIATRTHG